MSRRRTLTRWARRAAPAAAWLALAGPPQLRAQATDPAAPFLALTPEGVVAIGVAPPPSPGGDPRTWAAIARAGTARHVDAFPGADLLLRGDAAHVEALWWLAPGADPAALELVIPDATGFEASGAGHVIVRARGGDVVLLRPGLHQDAHDSRLAVGGGWEYRGQGRVGLDVETLDPAAPLAIGFRVLPAPGALRTLDRNGDGRVTLEELAPLAEAVEGGPSVTATKSDTLVLDVDGDGRADPGDTLRYDVVIANAGTDATSVQLADLLDPNLALVPGSLNVSPLAGDDSYEAIGHVTLTVSNPMQGLFANDSEFLLDTFVLTSPAPGVPTLTSGGGTVTVAADGTFSYTSPPGLASGSDTFGYTITDGGGLSGSGTVTFDIAGLVWFIDRDAAAGGTGTQASPFDELADVNGAGGVGDPDAPNHVIYLHDRAAVVDYVNGIELEAGQRLVGSGVPLLVGTTTVLPATTPPTVEHAGGDAVTLASGSSVEGLQIRAANDTALSGTGTLGAVAVSSVGIATSGTGGGIDLVNHGGTFTFTSGSITGNGTGAALRLNGGAGTVDLASSSINRTAGRLVDVQGKTAGSVAVGALTGTGAATDAIFLSNNGTTSFSFPNGFNVTTTDGRGLFASGSGTLTLGGSSTISATGGAAIEMSNSSFGGTATFASLSSASSAGHGLRLENGVAGTLSVTGGLTITNPATGGVSIQSTSANVNVAGNVQVSGGGQPRVLVTGSTGNVSFGPTTLAGGSDGVRLGGNTAGTRTFASLQVSGGTGSGFVHTGGGGATSVTGATVIQNPAGTAIDIQGSGSAITFATVTVDKSGTGGVGVNLASNTVAPSFAGLGITTSSGAGLALNASGIATASGSISAVGGPAINSSTGAFTATFGSVSSAGSPTQGISLVSSSGTLAAGGGSISGSAGTAFNVNGGSVSVTYGGSVTQNAAQRVVDVQGTTGGGVTIGSVTGGASSTGVNIGSANGNVTFSTLNLGTAGTRTANQAVTINGGTGTYNLGTVGIFTTGAARGLFSAGADGTLGVTAGTVDAAGAAAIDIDGPAGLTTLAVNLTRVDANGGTGGVLVQDANGAFTVVGAGTAGSGGTIQNTSVRGASFINATGIALNRMNFTNANGVDGATSDGLPGGNENTDENGALHLVNVTQVDLDGLQISGTAQHGINGNNVTDLDISNTTINNAGNEIWESGIYLFQLKGLPSANRTSTFSNVAVSNTGQFNLAVINSVGTNAPPGEKDRLELTSCNFSASGVSVIGDHVSVLNSVSANFQTVVSGSVFSATPGRTSDSIQVDASNAASSDVSISTSTFMNGNVAVNISGSGTGVNTFSVANNPSVSSRAGNTVNVAVNGASSLRGTIANNTITTNVGNNAGSGIDVVVDQTGSAVVDINGNAISGQSNGIRGGARNAGTGTADLTIRNNTVTSGGTSEFAGIWLFGGNGSVGETNRTCVNFVANTVDITTGVGFVDYYLEQFTGNVFQIQGLTGSGTNAANVAAFVAGTDLDPSPTDPTVDVGSGTLVNYTAAVCAVP
jgi:hypothetical protein